MQRKSPQNIGEDAQGRVPGDAAGTLKLVFVSDSFGGVKALVRADVVSSKLLDKLSYYKGRGQAREILRDVSWHPYQDRLVTAGFDGALVEWGYSAEPLGAHLDTLPDTGYDAVDENW